MPGFLSRLTFCTLTAFLAMPAQAKDLSLQQTRVEITLKAMADAKAEYDAAAQQEARSRKALEQQKKQLEQDQKKTAQARKKYQSAKSSHQQAQSALDQAWKQR